MNRFILLALCSIPFVACQKQEQSSGNSVKPGTPITYSQVIGKRLECDAPKGKADIFMVAPHMLAIMSTDPNYMLEYYRTDFLTKEGELYFQLDFYGRGDYQTQRVPADELKNRRIRLSFRDGQIKVLVAHGLDEKRQPVNPHEMNCTIAAPLENFFVPPQLMEKQETKQ